MKELTEAQETQPTLGVVYTPDSDMREALEEVEALLKEEV